MGPGEALLPSEKMSAESVEHLEETLITSSSVCLYITLSCLSFLGGRRGECHCAGDAGRHCPPSCNHRGQLCSAGF